ncbi:MAG: Mur ligase family protein [Thermoanaerobaculia bacterium]|nr:Mur ligase family protein [Thermoanaerobaculia bacterium]
MPSETIHIIAIGGTGVAPLACLLRREGYQVRGSDGPLYPPMSTLLESEGLEPIEGFAAANLHPRPDLVIVSNAVPRTNPEVAELERLGWPKLSMPEALGRHFLADRDPIVVTGTHGKTTTTCLLAWIYTRCGRSPGYLIGGVPQDLPAPFARGSGRRFVVEGDEYNTAYFDRGPKFLHYRPHTAIVTGLEHDHVDIYPTPESFREAFRKLVALLPADGLLVADVDAEGVAELIAEAACEVRTYGLGADAAVRPLAGLEASPEGTRFRLEDPEAGEVEVVLGVPGEHNARNAMAAWIVARHDGLPVADILEALRAFRGVRRRLETVGERDGTLVIDDFAHHPTEIRATLTALRQRHPGRRLVAVFEPRSLTSGRSFFFEAYLDAFRHADRVHLAPIFHFDRTADEERIDLGRLTTALAEAGVPATAWGSTEALEAALRDEAREGDLVVTMSSGSFGGLPQRLVAER